jgi:hypothetical protein
LKTGIILILCSFHFYPIRNPAWPGYLVNSQLAVSGAADPAMAEFSLLPSAENPRHPYAITASSVAADDAILQYIRR